VKSTIFYHIIYLINIKIEKEEEEESGGGRREGCIGWKTTCFFLT